MAALERRNHLWQPSAEGDQGVQNSLGKETQSILKNLVCSPSSDTFLAMRPRESHLTSQRLIFYSCKVVLIKSVYFTVGF